MLTIGSLFSGIGGLEFAIGSTSVRGTRRDS